MSRQRSHLERLDQHTYYNAIITNPTAVPVQATYSDSRTDALIDVPRDFHFYIERASVSSVATPLFIFEDGAYVVGLSYTTTYVQQALVFTSDSSVALSGYRDVYSINHFVKMINTAFAAAFATLSPSVPAPRLPNYPPQVSYDASTKLFSITAETLYDPTSTPTGTSIVISLNTRLYQMLGACWDSVYNGAVTSPTAVLDYQILIHSTNNNLVAIYPPTGPTPTANAYQMVGEFISSQLKSICRIVLLTSTIPVAQESIPKLVNGRVIEGNSSTPIVTDFAVNVDASENWGRPNYVYTPAYPRLTDLEGTSALQNITIQVMWQNCKGDLFPLYIPPFGEFSAKLVFRRKER